MVFNTFYFILLISKCFLGAAHSEVAILSKSQSKTLTSTHKKACSIPDFRKNDYIYLSLEGNKLDQEKCYDGSGKFVVRVNCFDDTKTIEPDSFAVCFDGKWYPSVHTCVQRTCEPVNDTVSTRHTCTTSKGDEVSCRLPAVPGTKITIRCAHWRYGFENFENSKSINRFCQKSGQWQTLEKCTPKSCSTKRPETSHDNSSLEANSSSSLELAKKYPWNAVIYRRNGDGWSRVCFGTIITDRIILTYSKYFNEINEENQTTGIRVAVGEYFKNYEDYAEDHLYDVLHIDPTIRSIDPSEIPMAYIAVVSRDIEFSDTVGFSCLGIHHDRMSIKHFGLEDFITLEKVGNILISEDDGNQFELPLTIEPCQLQFFCSLTNNRTFSHDELGGGLTFFHKNSTHTYLGGLLVIDFPVFLDIAILQNRFYIEKGVEKYYYSIGKKNENWSKRWSGVEQ